MQLLHPSARQGLTSAQRVAKATGKVQCGRSLWSVHERQHLYMHQSSRRLSPHTQYNPGSRAQDTVLHTHSTTYTHTHTFILPTPAQAHSHSHTYSYDFTPTTFTPAQQTHRLYLLFTQSRTWEAPFPTGHLCPCLQQPGNLKPCFKFLPPQDQIGTSRGSLWHLP